MNEKNKTKLGYELVRMVDVDAWDNLVEETYGITYNFQQQDGCKERGIFTFTIPSCDDPYIWSIGVEEEMYDNIPEEVNGEDMGVKFETWLARDPKDLSSFESEWELELFYERNFYPSIYTVADDLYSKGLVEAGTYVINIDW